MGALLALLRPESGGRNDRRELSRVLARDDALGGASHCPRDNESPPPHGARTHNPRSLGLDPILLGGDQHRPKRPQLLPGACGVVVQLLACCQCAERAATGGRRA